jgi:hypothetical protein
MERLELNILALVPEEVHHHLQVRLGGDVSRHYACKDEMVSIQSSLRPRTVRHDMCES